MPSTSARSSISFGGTGAPTRSPWPARSSTVRMRSIAAMARRAGSTPSAVFRWLGRFRCGGFLRIDIEPDLEAPSVPAPKPGGGLSVHLEDGEERLLRDFHAAHLFHALFPLLLLLEE